MEIKPREDGLITRIRCITATCRYFARRPGPYACCCAGCAEHRCDSSCPTTSGQPTCTCNISHTKDCAGSDETMRAHPSNPRQYYSREEWRRYERQNRFTQDYLWNQCQDEAIVTYKDLARQAVNAVYQQVDTWMDTGPNMHGITSIHGAVASMAAVKALTSSEVNWEEAALWEVLTDSGWQFYEPGIDRTLQIATACGKEAVYFQCWHWSYSVRFTGIPGEAVQQNVITNATRAMRNTRLQATYQRHVAHVLVKNILIAIASQNAQRDPKCFPAR